MMTQLSNLNWISVLMAFVAYFLLGGLWFTKLFGGYYKLSLGLDENAVLANSPIFIVGPALCTLVVTLTTAILFYALNVSTVGDTIVFTLLIGIGFLVANTVNIAINPNMPHPIFYSVISGGYHLVGLSMATTILFWMKK